MVYKINESIIVIQAEATSPNRTNVVFWSHDRGTAKLRMKLVRKNGIPQSLPEGTTVPIRLMFKSATAEGGYGKHDYLATIEDRLGGIVSIVLEDNILGYVGTVEGSVYINFPDNRSLDTAGRFTFTIRRSPIDETTSELEDYYFNGFSQTIDKIEKIMTDGKQAIDQKIADSKQKINENMVETNNQITQVNQSIETLNHEVTEANNRIDQTNQQISDLGNLKKMYSNSTDFGDYDYSGNPNLAPNLKYSDARTSGNATISDNGTSLSYASEVGAVGTVLLPFSPYLPNKTYTLTIKVRLDETSIPSISSFIGVSYSIPSSGAPLYTNIIRTSNMELGVEKTYTHTVTTGDIVNASGWALRLYTAGGDLIKYDLSYEVKLETGSSATPYQPNLLLAPYEISKVALNSNLARNGMTPITNSNYLINTYPLLERMKQGDSITITLKGTKLGTNQFRLYMATFDSQGANIANEHLGDMTSVDGLTDTWKLTISSYSWDNTDLEQRLRVYQRNGTTLGSATITWCKIERGLVATPPITVYKYFGEGLRDSNNPNDYSWNITPEYAEKSLNNTVSLTEPQSIEGLKNFEDGIQSKGKSVLTSDDMKTAVYTLTMSDVPDSTITELTGELVRVNNYVKLRCRVNASAGAKVVFRVREGYRENIEDVWEIPLTAISQADHKNQVAYYALTEANKREIRLVTVTAGNHFITGSWRTDDLWPTL